MFCRFLGGGVDTHNVFVSCVFQYLIYRVFNIFLLKYRVLLPGFFTPVLRIIIFWIRFGFFIIIIIINIHF